MNTNATHGTRHNQWKLHCRNDDDDGDDDGRDDDDDDGDEDNEMMMIMMMMMMESYGIRSANDKHQQFEANAYHSPS